MATAIRKRTGSRRATAVHERRLRFANGARLPTACNSNIHSLSTFSLSYFAFVFSIELQSPDQKDSGTEEKGEEGFIFFSFLPFPYRS
jgi:hypothetical protein